MFTTPSDFLLLLLLSVFLPGFQVLQQQLLVQLHLVHFVACIQGWLERLEGGAAFSRLKLLAVTGFFFQEKNKHSHSFIDGFERSTAPEMKGAPAILFPSQAFCTRSSKNPLLQQKRSNVASPRFSLSDETTDIPAKMLSAGREEGLFSSATDKIQEKLPGVHENPEGEGKNCLQDGR